MNINETTQLSSGTTLHIINISMTDFYDQMVAAQHTLTHIAYRFLRGHKCQTEAALFDEFAAGLQFPYYFGENWDALEECCRDLAEIRQQSHCVIIGNAHHLLKNDDDAFKIFIETMNRVIQDSITEKKGFFSVILQSESSSFNALNEKLTRLNVPFVIALS